MKTKRFAVFLAVNLGIVIGAHAQDATSVSADIGDQIEVTTTASERPAKPEKPERPERPDRRGISTEMKALVAEYRSKVSEFHSEQKELVKKPRAEQGAVLEAGVDVKHRSR